MATVPVGIISGVANAVVAPTYSYLSSQALEKSIPLNLLMQCGIWVD